MRDVTSAANNAVLADSGARSSAPRVGIGPSWADYERVVAQRDALALALAEVQAVASVIEGPLRDEMVVVDPAEVAVLVDVIGSGRSLAELVAMLERIGVEASRVDIGCWFADPYHPASALRIEQIVGEVQAGVLAHHPQWVLNVVADTDRSFADLAVDADLVFACDGPGLDALGDTGPVVLAASTRSAYRARLGVGNWAFDAGRPAEPLREVWAQLLAALESAVTSCGVDALDRLDQVLDALDLSDETRMLWPAPVRDVIGECVVARAARAAVGSTPRPTQLATVLVDSRCLQDGGLAHRGVGRHVHSLLASIVASVPEGCRVLLGIDPTAGPVLVGDIEGTEWVDIRTCDRMTDIDVFIAASPMTASTSMVSGYIIDPDVYRIAVVFDLIPAHHRSQYLGDDLVRLDYFAHLLTLTAYDEYWPISESVADELRSVMGRQDAAIHVTTVGCDHGEPHAETLIEAAYLLAPTGGDPRKNLLAAVAAASQVRRTIGNAAIVAVGGLTEAQMHEAQALHRELGGADSDLVFASGLEESALAALQRDALVTIVPSFDEGFSMPVVESLLAGTPVVASDIGAHRELLGDGYWLCSCDDVDAYAAAIIRAIGDDELLARQRARLGERGTNAAVAGVVASRVRELQSVRHRPGPARSAVRRDRPHLVVTTPWPPERSGIADYSLVTLKELARHVDVTVVTTARNPVSCESIAVRSLDRACLAGLRCDALVHVIGNSYFHTGYLELLADHGGVSLVHDNRMIDLYRGWRGDGVAAAMIDAGNPPDASKLDGYVRDLDTLPNLCFGDIARRSDRLLVHSQLLAERAARETGATVTALPFVPYNLPSAAITADKINAARVELGWKKDTQHVLTLGIVDPLNKGVDSVVDAIAMLRCEGIAVHLSVVGDCHPDLIASFTAHLADRGVRDAVSFLGHVDRMMLERLLIAADVGVQLRTSRLLSLSGALADCIAFGLPAVTTSALAADMCVPNYVTAVPERCDAATIATAIRSRLSLRRDDGPNIERERLRYLDERSVARYAIEFLQALQLSC